MKKCLTFPLVITLLFLIFSNMIYASKRTPVKGGKLPPINLPVPRETKERNYLGLSSGSFFRIPQIKAEIIIIEIFSLYCPACVKLASGMKELYQVIENDSKFKGKIKIIGIGAGNTPYEVQTFKNIGETPFPLFPDKDFTIHEAIGDVRTPYFIGIKIHGNGTHEIFFSEMGGFKDAQTFLELMVTLTGLRIDETK
jgi:hypothetical protein